MIVSGTVTRPKTGSWVSEAGLVTQDELLLRETLIPPSKRETVVRPNRGVDEGPIGPKGHGGLAFGVEIGRSMVGYGIIGTKIAVIPRSSKRNQWRLTALQVVIGPRGGGTAKVGVFRWNNLRRTKHERGQGNNALLFAILVVLVEKP